MCLHTAVEALKSKVQSGGWVMSTMLCRLKSCAILWPLVLVLLSTGVRLEGQAIKANVIGRVTDSSGAAVAGAKITVKNVGTGVTQTATSDDQGRYTVPDLDVGTYQVDADMAGFKHVIRTGIDLTVGAQVTVDIPLEVGAAEQTVTVEGQVSQVETTSSAVGSLVEPTQIANLPLNGRNFTQLLTLAPGVVTGNYQISLLGGRGASYSVSGSRAFGELFLLDNTNSTDFFGHSVGGSSVTGEALGVDSIAEFQMLTNTYSAQYGGAGAVLDAVSKSGTNSFHGTAYEYIRNSVLDSRNHFDPARIPPFRRNQFGGSIGGPIKKDKAFFFVNYEGLRQLLGVSQPVFVPDANARKGILPSGPIPASANNATGQVAPNIVSTLALYPLPANAAEIGGGIARYTAEENQLSHENYLLTRFDYTLSEKDSLFLRYVLDYGDFTDPGLPAIPLWLVYATSGNNIATIEEKHIASQNLVNLARFSFVRATQINTNVNPLQSPPLLFYPVNLPFQPRDGSITVTGLSSIGPGAAAPKSFVPNHFVVADDLLWTHGAHSFRFGMSVERVQDNVNSPFNEEGSYIFSSLLGFLQGNPVTFQGVGTAPTNADAFRDARELFLTPYIQDDWKITQRLTLNLGLRYDWAADPTEVGDKFHNLLNPRPVAGQRFVSVPHAFAQNPATDNFDPRIGLAYDPFNDHKTAIRAGFGIFRDVINASKYLTPYALQPPYLAVTIAGVPITYGPAAPNVAKSSGVISSTQLSDYQTSSTPYVMQYNLNVQRELGTNTVLTVGYVGNRGVHQLLASDQNPPTNTGTAQNPVLASLIGGRIVSHPRSNPAYGFLVDFVPDGYSDYNSLQASLDHHLSRNFQTQISYTYSKCLDLNSDATGVEGEQFGSGTEDTNPYFLRNPYGPCDNDRRHNFIASGVYQFPFQGDKFVQGWQVSGIWNWVSGAPFSPVIGFDQAGAGPPVPIQEQRPNWAAGCDPQNAILGVGVQWFKPSCFTLPTLGTIGDVGRNSLDGPRLFKVDMALFKDTKVSERLNLQFRAEAFNLFNEANLTLVGKPGGLGVFTQGLGGTGSISPSAGQMTSTATASRQMQFELRFLF